jgi:hypothetical protein
MPGLTCVVNTSLYKSTDCKPKKLTRKVFDTLLQVAIRVLDQMLSKKKRHGSPQCLTSKDSDLEAFSRIPTGGGTVVLTTQPATFTKYLNEVFLSY